MRHVLSTATILAGTLLATALLATTPAQAGHGNAAAPASLSQPNQDRGHRQRHQRRHQQQRLQVDFDDRYFWQRQSFQLRELVRQQRPDLDLRHWRLSAIQAHALAPTGHGRLALHSRTGRLDAARVAGTGHQHGNPFSKVLLTVPERPGRGLTFTVGRGVVLDRIDLVLEPRNRQPHAGRQQPAAVAWTDRSTLRSSATKVRSLAVTLPDSRQVRLTGEKRGVRVAEAWLQLANGERIRVPALEGVVRAGDSRVWSGKRAAQRLTLTLAPLRRDQRGYLTVASA